jgi:hypothetical protein
LDIILFEFVGHCVVVVDLGEHGRQSGCDEVVVVEVAQVADCEGDAHQCEDLGRKPQRVLFELLLEKYGEHP